MDPSVRGYLAEIGRRGGRRSRRYLSPEAAREYVPWVAERLMTYGGREGWEIGAKLCR